MDPVPTDNKVEDLLEKCFNCQQVFFLAELAEHMDQCPKKASSTTTNSATTEDENNETSPKVDDSYFIQKYGQGMVSEVKCPKCGHEVQLHSVGTHTSDSGSIKIYADDEEFVCTNSECSNSELGTNNMLIQLTSSPFDVEDSNKAPEASWDGPADICNLVEQTMQYCQEHEITNPVEVLRYYQSVMVTGRPLNVVDNSQASEGPTNYMLIDRYNIVQTAFDEIKTMGNLRQTLEVQFYGEEAEDIGGPRREFFRLIVREIFNIYFEQGLKAHMAEDYQLIGMIFGLSMVQDGKVPKFKEDILKAVFSSSVDDPCLNQLRTGLKKTGIFQLAMNMDIFQQLFREKPQGAMTVKMLNCLLKPAFSEEGSNARESESSVYRAFQKYLGEVASGRRTGLNLGTILQFATGSDEEPVLGFSIDPCLKFHEVSSSFLPMANTCANTLQLPRPTREHNLPETNKLFELYDMAFKNAYFGSK